MTKPASALLLALFSSSALASEAWLEVATDRTDGAIWSFDSSGGGLIDLGNIKTAFFKKRWPKQKKTMTLWISIECNSNRIRVGDVTDISIDPNGKEIKDAASGVWVKYDPGTIGNKLHDIVCN